jgi:hypothetical protein
MYSAPPDVHDGRYYQHTAKARAMVRVVVYLEDDIETKGEMRRVNQLRVVDLGSCRRAMDNSF